MNPVLNQAKKNMKKQFNKIKKEMLDYELYKEFYDFMKCSPMMQTIIKENRELKMFNKILLETVDELKKQLRMKEFADVKVKKEKFVDVVDLTDEYENVEDEPNIVYEIVEDEPNIVYEIVEENIDFIAYKKDTTIEEGEIVEEEVEVDEEEVEEVEGEEEEVEEVEEVEGEEEEVEEVEEEEEEVEGEEEEVEGEEEEVEEVEEVEGDEEEVDEDEEEEVEEVEEAEEEVEVEGEEEEEVYETKINSKTYYVTNEKNGTIYSVTTDGDIGDEVGKFVDSKPLFK
jgi:myosin heavy subunit